MDQQGLMERTKIMTRVHPRPCNAKKHDGSRCQGPAMRGLDKCRIHTGMTLAKAKAKGLVVAELAVWGLDGHKTLADPGETLLKLVTQSAARVQLYSSLLARAYEETGAGNSLDPVMRQGGVGALIGYRYGVDKEGNTFPVEEAIRGLAQLEQMERKLCGDFSAKAIAAGLAERQVRMAEQQGTLIVELLRRVQNALDLTPEQTVRYAAVVSQELRELAA